MKQIKKTVTLLRRSPYQALAAALAMSLTFFITSIFVVLIIGGQIVLNFIEQRPQVIAFFKDDVAETQILEIVDRLGATNLTRDVKYVSKDEALAIYRERNKDEPLLLESVTADFLPASIDISSNRAQDINEITSLLKNIPEVERIITPQNLVDQLVKWTKTIRTGGLIFVSVLLSISFLIVVMVIGMRISLRRDEINIMNLVGATKWYISRPFFIEGVIYGLLGSTVAVFLTYTLLLFYSPNIQEFLGPIEVFPISPLFFIYLWAAEALIATFVGLFGAAISLFRYLKVK